MNTKTLAKLFAAAAIIAAPLLLAISAADAGTVSVNPAEAAVTCHIAFSTTSGAAWTTGTINVTGDCIIPPVVGSGGSTPCYTYACNYNTSYASVPSDVAFTYWTGAHEIMGLIMTSNGTTTPTAWWNSNCGFGERDIAIDDTPTGTTAAAGLNSSFNPAWDTSLDSAATAAMQAAGPASGSVTTTTGGGSTACTGGSSLKVFVMVENVGTTNIGTASYVYVQNGYCEVSEASGCTGTNLADPGNGGGDYTNLPTLGDLWANGTLATTSNDDVPAGCGLLDITGNEAGPVQVAGVEYPYTLDFTGTVDAIIATDTSETSVTNSYDGKTFDTPFLQDIDPGPGLTTSQTISYMAATGDVVNPTFWCLSGGVWYDWGSISSNDTSGLQYEPPNGSPTGDQTASCWAGTWSITDFGTDLLNVGKDFECVLRGLFEPSNDDMENFTNLFGFTSSGGASGCEVTNPGLATGTVTQWLGAGFTLITDGPSCSFNTMASEEAAGETSTYLTEGDSYTASTGRVYTVSLPAALTVTTSSSPVALFFTILLAILEAVMGVFFFFAIKDVIQALLSRNG